MSTVRKTISKGSSYEQSIDILQERSLPKLDELIELSTGCSYISDESIRDEAVAITSGLVHIQTMIARGTMGSPRNFDRKKERIMEAVQRAETAIEQLEL